MEVKLITKKNVPNFFRFKGSRAWLSVLVVGMLLLPFLKNTK